MAVPINSTFAGQDASRLRIEEPLRVTDVRTIVGDSNRVHERITGLAADQSGTTASSTNAQHTHAEEGNILSRQFCACTYGTRGPHGLVAQSNAAVTTNARAVLIQEDSSTTDDSLNVVAGMFFIPPGWVDRDIILLWDCDGDPRMTVTIRDVSSVAVTGYSNLSVVSVFDLPQAVLLQTEFARADGSRGPNLWGCVFRVSATGVYWAHGSLNLRSGTLVREFFGLNVVGAVDVTKAGAALTYEDAVETQQNGNSVQVGDADASNAHQPIDELFIPSAGDRSLNAALATKMAENSNRDWEAALGIPAPGNDTLTITPHKHDGSSGSGAELEWAHVASILGFVAGANPSELLGNKSKCPNNYSATWRTVAVNRVMMPASANTTALASKVKCAVLVYVQPSKGNVAEVAVTFGSTTLAFRSTNPTPALGFEVLTVPYSGSNAFAFTAESLNAFAVELHASTLSATGYVQVCAVLLYTDN